MDETSEKLVVYREYDSSYQAVGSITVTGDSALFEYAPSFPLAQKHARHFGMLAFAGRPV